MKYLFFFLLITLVSTALAQNQKWRVLGNSPQNGSSGRMEDIHFINANTGWVLVPNGPFPDRMFKVSKTTNAGATWITTNVDTMASTRCINFADSLNGWIGTLKTLGTIIYRTSDGGVTWAPSLNTTIVDSNGVCGIWAINKNVVYATGRYYGPPKFYKTTNGGNTWSVTNLQQYGIYQLIDCKFFNQDSGFITGGTGINFSQSKAVVLFTSNGGATWVNKFTSNNTYNWGWKIDFPSRDTGYIAVERLTLLPRYFLKTTNGGETWEEKVFIDSLVNVQGIGFINNLKGWNSGNFSNGFETTDGGESWHPHGLLKNVNRFRIINDTLAYACGNRVYKYSNDTTVNISNVSNAIPEKFKLYQNYPNPFNPITKIKFEISKSGFVKLIIYNSLGEEVMSLLNTKLKSGTFEYTFDGAELSSGVYIYKIITGSYSETKKMLLVK